MITTSLPNVCESEKLTIAKCAKALGVTPSTIYRWTNDGLLRCHVHRHNGFRYWLGADIIRFWKSEK